MIRLRTLVDVILGRLRIDRQSRDQEGLRCRQLGQYLYIRRMLWLWRSTDVRHLSRTILTSLLNFLLLLFMFARAIFVDLPRSQTILYNL